MSVSTDCIFWKIYKLLEKVKDCMSYCIFNLNTIFKCLFIEFLKISYLTLVKWHYPFAFTDLYRIEYR